MSGRATNRSKKVKVWARIRPTSSFPHECFELSPDEKSIAVHLRRDGKKEPVSQDWSFELDGIFHNATQDHVFSTLVPDMVTSALDGYNGALMCYGQTGAGKTFTITGASEVFQHRGMIPRALCFLFKEIKKRSESSIMVSISYMEIYNEALHDLLSTLQRTEDQAYSEPLVLTENQHGVCAKGLSSHLVQSEEEALNLLFEGEANRAVGVHSLNHKSSRSHCIFTVYINSRPRVVSSPRYTQSKLNIVDLAGSERMEKSNSRGKLLKESMYINKSLSFLEQMVTALADKRPLEAHFRQCKLTHYLKDCIGGNCNIVFIANIRGEETHLEETVSTLRFATSMMCIVSDPTINELCDQSACGFCKESHERLLLLKQMEKEVNVLKAELAVCETLGHRGQAAQSSGPIMTEQQKSEMKDLCQRFLEGDVDDIEIICQRQIHQSFDAIKEIYRQMERDVEVKLRKKLNLSRGSAEQDTNAAADEGSGGRDKNSRSSRSDTPRSARAERTGGGQMKKDRDKGKKKVARRASVSSGVEREKEREESPARMSSVETTPEPEESPQPVTPPDRATMFEEFKQGNGQEIYKILLENKETLTSLKKTYFDLGTKINATKKDIDCTRLSLDKLQIKRYAAGTTYDNHGDVVISEEEFLKINQLKQLKTAYHSNFEKLTNVKSQIQQCQQLVNRCRQRLVTEFDTWYTTSFLIKKDRQARVKSGQLRKPVVSTASDSHALPEDTGEMFDRIRVELFKDTPDYLTFYNAVKRTQQRKMFEAATSQPQPSYRKKVGTPAISMRNKPPNVLHIQH